MKPTRLLPATLATLLWCGGATTSLNAQPNVSGATPGQVELLSGGESIAVEISGADLQLAERAAVLLNGKSAADVTVKLASSTGSRGSRRMVFLQALESAPAAAGLELVLYGPSTDRSAPGGIPVPLEISVAVPAPASRGEVYEKGAPRDDPAADPGPEWPVVLSAGRLEFTPGAAPATFTPITIQTATLEFTPQAAPPTFTPATIQAGRLEFTPEATP